MSGVHIKLSIRNLDDPAFRHVTVEADAQRPNGGTVGRAIALSKPVSQERIDQAAEKVIASVKAMCGV